MKNFFRLNERGYLLLNVVFLTLITSFAAMILLNAAPRVRNPQSTMRLIALNLANEQLAQLEANAAAGESIGGGSFLGSNSDLTNDSFRSEDSPTVFTVETTISGSGTLRDAKVKVKWQFGGKNFEVEAERTICVAQ